MQSRVRRGGRSDATANAQRCWLSRSCVRRTDLSVGNETASRLSALLAEQPSVDPACEKSQLASPADSRGSQLAALNRAVDCFRATACSICCLMNRQPSNLIAHDLPRGCALIVAVERGVIDR